MYRLLFACGALPTLAIHICTYAAHCVWHTICHLKFRLFFPFCSVSVKPDKWQINFKSRNKWRGKKQHQPATNLNGMTATNRSNNINNDNKRRNAIKLCGNCDKWEREREIENIALKFDVAAKLKSGLKYLEYFGCFGILFVAFDCGKTNTGDRKNLTKYFGVDEFLRPAELKRNIAFLSLSLSVAFSIGFSPLY